MATVISWKTTVCYSVLTIAHSVLTITHYPPPLMTAYCSDIDTCRTLRQIIQPAVSALIASTYLSVHQNINRRGLPWYSEAVNTVIIIIVALLVPEWIFMWALRSYIIARRTQRELEQARSEAKSEWGNPGFVGNLPLACKCDIHLHASMLLTNS